MPKNKASNTVTTLEMNDGSTVKLTLSYRYLLKLSKVNRDVYNEYNAIWSKKNREEIDNVRIVYAAYLCALIQDGAEDEAMSWDQFLDAVTTDREALGIALVELLAPKRKGDIEKRSE